MKFLLNNVAWYETLTFLLERVYHVLGIYTSSLTTHETHTYCQRRKKVRKALKLLPYRIIGHFKQNDELGFFFFPQMDSQHSVLAIEEYYLVMIYRFIPMD